MSWKKAVMLLSFVAVFFGAQALWSPSPAPAGQRGQMQGRWLPVSVTISSQRGNPIKLEALRLLYQVQSAHPGMAAGQKQYNPIVVTREVDRDSAFINHAVETNEQLTVDIELVKLSLDGRPLFQETIRLTNAVIGSYKLYVGVPTAGEPPDPRPLEDIVFNFQRIEIMNK